MMMNRGRFSFWARVVAITLAALFLVSSVAVGFGSAIQYNLLQVLGSESGQQQQQGPTPEEQITSAEEELEQNPEDPDAITTLAVRYAQNGQLDKAAEVLERGREVAPEDEEIATLLGQVYSQQAQSASGEEKRELYRQAGDAFAAATEIESDDAEAYLNAGNAYAQAGENDKAIEYWNGYLDLEPEGEQAEAVKERISELLRGGPSTTGGETTGGS